MGLFSGKFSLHYIGMKLPLLLLLCLLPCGSVFAEGGEAPIGFFPKKESSCSPLDVRKKRPELKEYYSTPKTQDLVGWCYASAAAELLTHKLGREVSGIDLAITGNKHIRANPIRRTLRTLGDKLGISTRKDGVYEAGYIGQVIVDARKIGVCPADRMPSHIDEKKDTTGLELVSVIRSLGNLGREIRETGVSYEVFEQTLACAEELGMVNGFDDFFPGIDNRAFFELLSKKADQDVNDILADVADLHCGKHRVVIPKKLKVKYAGSSFGEKVQAIDYQLKRGNPVGIEFFTRMLKPGVGFTDAHAATLVARKFIHGECRYLLRNSWGCKCRPYHKKMQPYCEPQSGSIWVSENELFGKLNSVVYLE